MLAYPQRLLNARNSILCLILTILACSGCTGESTAGSVPTPADHSTPVRLSTVVLSEPADALQFAGVTRVRQRATVTFQVSGVLRDRPVELGQSVQAGQVVATLHNPALQPSRDAAQAALAQLETEAAQSDRELRRIEALYRRAVVPEQELEQQQARVESLQAALNTARANLVQAQQLLNESRLLAPFDGRVESIMLEPGEFVQAGQPVMRIAAANGLEAEIRVPAHLQSSLYIGQQLAVDMPLGNLSTTGTIIDLGTSNTTDSALYPVVLALAVEGLRTGESIEVSIPWDNQPQLTIPISAVMRSAGGLSVFTVENEIARRTPVSVARIQGEYAVLSIGSLPAGTKVVYSGLTRLADGDRIRVLP
jgi:membrane fusion protein, multidrug efflux system